MVAAAQDPSDLEFFTLSTAPRLFAAPNARAWSCGSRISLCASLRVPRADCYARGERRTPSGTGLRPLYKLGNAAVQKQTTGKIVTLMSNDC